MKLSPQDLDRLENERLDDELTGGSINGVSSFGRHSSMSTVHVPLDKYLPPEKQAGRPRYTFTGRHRPHATLDQIERR